MQCDCDKNIRWFKRPVVVLSRREQLENPAVFLGRDHGYLKIEAETEKVVKDAANIILKDHVPASGTDYRQFARVGCALATENNIYIDFGPDRNNSGKFTLEVILPNGGKH